MINDISGKKTPPKGGTPISPDIRPPDSSSEVMVRIKNAPPDMDLELQEMKQALESSARYHELRMFAIKWCTRILFFGGTTIMLTIFFVIMPFSEMDLGANSRIEWIQNYSTAFLRALGNFGITVLAVIVSELLKLLYKFMRSSKELE